jgi:hypothetical protein
MASKSKAKNKVHHLYNETFKFNVYVVLGGTQSESNKLFQKAIGGKWKVRVEGASAVHAHFTKDGVIGSAIWIGNPDDDADFAGTVVHECLHGVFRQLESKGMVLNESTQETYCYLLGWMVEQIHKLK